MAKIKPVNMPALWGEHSPAEVPPTADKGKKVSFLHTYLWAAQTRLSGTFFNKDLELGVGRVDSGGVGRGVENKYDQNTLYVCMKFSKN